MTTRTQQAIAWINSQDTKHARTMREKAKYLVATTLPRNMPHPAIWWAVLKIKSGITTIEGA